MDIKNKVTRFQKEYNNANADIILVNAIKYFSKKIIFASSLGQEDQVITHIISKNKLDIPIFTLDTGRLFAETYNLISKTEKQYRVKINTYFPKSEKVEMMVKDKGINLFYDSIENRKQCCEVRKMEPLSRALNGYDAWICGLRKSQTITRNDISIIEYDVGNDMVKLNPLANWSNNDLLEYIKKNNILYNPLHDKGFISIGCSCCTRPVQKGQDIRAGRWWWETPEQKECGLHIVNGELTRRND